MANSELYNEAFHKFREDAANRYPTGKDMSLLQDFLRERGSPEETMTTAQSLKADAAKKYGDKKVGDVKIPGPWIDSILGNIGTFIQVGNYAMKGAPESVGLAWFAVKTVLSAIQNNHELYGIFGSGLSNITEIMVLVSHYDRLYYERTKVDWKPSTVVSELFKYIVETYTDILAFSFSVKRHISGDTFDKIRHGVKDFFGSNKTKFEGRLKDIAAKKAKILEYSKATYDDVSLGQLQSISDVAVDIQQTVGRIEQMQPMLMKFHEEQMSWFNAVANTLEDIKVSMKPKTPWDFAMQDFERVKTTLSPSEDTSSGLTSILSKKAPGTCEWIYEHDYYRKWEEQSRRRNETLCISGIGGCGKSTVLASVHEHLAAKTDGATTTTLVYFSCEPTSNSSAGASKNMATLSNVCNTVMYNLYKFATHDKDDVALLEDCNKVFEDPKAKPTSKSSSGKVRVQNMRQDYIPDMSHALSRLSTLLKTNVIVVIDAVENLPKEDQKDLATKLERLAAVRSTQSIRVLVGCRAGEDFCHSISSDEAIATIDVGAHNGGDMEMVLSAALKDVVGFRDGDKEAARSAILDTAKADFDYLIQRAIPFLQEPFDVPIVEALKELPRPEKDLYKEALESMGSNYISLLRTAVSWCLLSPDWLPTEEEVMDTFHRIYDSGREDDDVDLATESGFPAASAVARNQLNGASGLFLQRLTVGPTNFINLRDWNQIEKFCLSSPSTVGTPEAEDVTLDQLCVRCKSKHSEPKRLNIIPKDDHLDRALVCLRHLNSPLFQKRAGLLAEPYTETPEEDAPIAAEEASELKEPILKDKDSESIEIPAVNNDNSESERPIVVNEGSESLQPQAENNDDSGYISDDSMDEEDRPASDLPDQADSSGDDGSDDNAYIRYEIRNWPYHLRMAETLWDEEERKEKRWLDVMAELDRFAENTPLFNAWQMQYSKAKRRLGEDAPVKVHKKLHVAAYLGLTSWAERLLQQGADPNELSGPLNALQFAALNANSPAMLKLLLEHHGDINAESDEYIPAFQMWLARNSSCESLRLMLENGADPLIVAKANGWTALHFFAHSGQEPEALNLILDHHSPSGRRPDINALTPEKQAPIHILLHRNEVPQALLKEFLVKGADLNLDDDTSARPLQMASVWGALDVMRIMFEHGVTEIDDLDDDQDSALNEAALHGHLECLEFLVGKGARIDIVNKYGQTALYYAAMHGSKDCIEKLLELGADPNHPDKHNRTPLFQACSSESQEGAVLILDALLERKVPVSEINQPTTHKRTPLRQAASRGFGDVLDKLIKAAKEGGDDTAFRINEADARKGMTALHRAALYGHTDCVRLLLDAGADASLEDSNAKTALKLAYEKWALLHDQASFHDIIAMLIDNAPDTAKADTELHAICTINGSMVLLRKLHLLGTDLSRQDRYGWTPLDLARKYQQAEAEAFLHEQAAWAGMRPRRWVAHLKVSMSDDGLTITYTSGERLCVSADRPLPAGVETYYFEVRFPEAAATTGSPQGGRQGPPAFYPEVAIGFCTLGGSAVQFPGWAPRLDARSSKSWGYHGDDGGFFSSARDDSQSAAQGPRYGAGDTVGCGVDMATGTMWFTRNGKKLAHTFSDVQGRLFPLLGLKHTVQIETNFNGPYLWNPEAEEESDRVKSSE